MRASEVKSKIVTAIEGTTIDAKVSHMDVFKHLDMGQRPLESARERLFSVMLRTVPMRARQLITQDNYVATWDVQVFYRDAPSVDDRITEDCERITRSLEALPGLYADLSTIDVSGGSIMELDGFLQVILSVAVNYRLTSGV